MEKVLIKYLSLLNFKGIKDFDIETDGKSVTISGDNRTGKTTIFDAFCWLMFGKDSLNSAAFEIKPLTITGEALHGLDHEVKAILFTNNTEITLRKVYNEKYTKRRGAAKEKFTGHTTEHFVNGVPCKQKEFNAAVNGICNEENFKLLTNPRYFNEILHWTDRRRLLLEVCGDIPDENVISHPSNDGLERLPDILGNHTIEQEKKIIAAKNTEINKILDKIPARIQENHKSIVEISDDSIQLPMLIEQAKQAKNTAEKDLDNIRTGGGIAEKEKALAELEANIQAHKNKTDRVKYERQSIQRRELAEVDKKAIDAAAKTELAVIRQTEKISRKAELNKALVGREKKREEHRNKWIEVNSIKYTPITGDNLCASCGQALPADQVEKAARLALEDFNNAKAETLTKIADKGKLVADQIVKTKKDIEAFSEQIRLMDDDIKSLAELQDVVERGLDITKARHEKENETVAPDLELDDLVSQADLIKLEINGLRAGNYETELAAENELERAGRILDAYQKDALQIENNQSAHKRIIELEAQERTLAGEIENLEADLFVIENFIRAKVSMLEKKINKKFQFATFRMFTENINGGLEECCDTTFDGVPYNSMNNGGRINIGLDICNTLSEHYKISLPVFIDNSEAVTKLFDSDAQQIRLFVSEADKRLKIQNN